jgi:formate hydrogenlyase transcriptional activator
LRNVIERAMILSTGPTLHIDQIRFEDLETPHDMTLKEVERKHIPAVLKRTGWRVNGKNGAAEILKLKPTALRSRMAKLDIEKPR